jgi:hypothetical protein
MPQIQQMAAKFPASADRVFGTYLDASLDAAFTGAAVIMGARAGSEFRAFNGVLSGQILSTGPKWLIVQSWRASHRSQDDLDSTRILTFGPEAEGARIDLCRSISPTLILPA